jgi:hypothetical protein
VKITIELSDAQVRGLKNYLKEVCDIEKPTKQDIKEELQSELESFMQSDRTAVADYIRAEIKSILTKIKGE